MESRIHIHERVCSRLGLNTLRVATMALALSGTLVCAADFDATVGVDPADEQGMQPQSLGMTSGPSMSAALGFRVYLRQTSNLTDVMRATRTQENDVLIGPPQIAASALGHGYEMLARDPRSAQFVLVVRPEVKTMAELAGKKLYLTQQDSLRAYMARALFADADFDMHRIGQVVYGKTSGAGLLALQSGLADATVAEQGEAQEWIRKNPGRAAVLKTSQVVPAGSVVMVLPSVGEDVRRNLLRWALSADASGAGKLQAATAADLKGYRYIASLTPVTPPAISGVTLVDAAETTRLMGSGAVVVDTRSPKEFEFAHVTGAINLPYVERSLKDKEFEAGLDNFAALSKAPNGKGLVFYCNGPECWKSYKASRTASLKGHKNIYWYRKGLPDWREKGLPITAASNSKGVEQR